jgi:alkanesulfonate monooxygenase SsuD/methylene tetrahydromethanopterin reductase-like flavin-dependent oxidoreductase (luciferase family)
MKFGLIPIEDSQHYAESLHQVELAEALSFDSVWLEEHHGTSGHYHPSPFIYLAGYATRTNRITLGTNIAILPLYHPTRVAEDVAQLDVMSNGRVILGAAIGYRAQEFDAFQTPLDGRGAQFVEMLQLINLLWTEENVTFQGSRYSLNEFTLEPRPVQQPRPPIWLGGWGKLAVKRAAILGDAWLPGPTANLTKLLEAQGRYHAQLAELGIDPSHRPRPLTRDVVIASSKIKAEQRAQQYLLPAYRDEYSSWEHPLIGASDTTATDILAELRRDRFIIGNPQQVIEQIRDFERRFGMDHLICRLHFPGMPPQLVTEAIELIGREVIPAYAQRVGDD